MSTGIAGTISEDIPAHLPANIDFVDVYLNGPGAVDVYHTPCTAGLDAVGHTRIRLEVASPLHQGSSLPAEVHSIATNLASTSAAFACVASNRVMPSVPPVVQAESRETQAPPPTDDTADWAAPFHSIATDLASPSAALEFVASTRATLSVFPVLQAASLEGQAPPPTDDAADWEVPDSEPEDLLVLPRSLTSEQPDHHAPLHGQTAASTTSTSPPPSSSDSWLDGVSPSAIPPLLNLPSDILQMLLDSDSDVSEPHIQAMVPDT
ncbi:hypothetical protein FA95DRAFT_1613013 [Auriscalpium vulgare]|uniref:Uncharacterized protein n=1 Tax=Auriscalpium vulgare TaxID=40419 RepID=A0ACB8R4J4_9AGAM|nr:hypothetical protein FA95DRAFT_1613013 [Auriscalpium vulgare]